ncbi:MAG: lysylphosphatidylglycerol synthase domain-containing protein [Betaproteobacteria bacterium]
MKHWAQRILAVSITLALLGWMLLDARFDDVSSALQRVPAATLAIVLAALFASYAVRALRIRAEFRSTVAAPYAEVLRVVLMHNAWVNVLPFRSGELAFPLLMRRQFGVSLERAAASLLWLRAQDACVLALAAALAVPGLPLPWRAALLAAVLGGTLALWRLARTAQPLPWPLAERLRSALAAASGSPWQTWAWTLANWVIKLLALTALLAALLPAPARVAAAGALGAEAAAVLPIQGVAGFGTYEAGAAAMLAPAGVAPAVSLPAAFVMHLVVVVSAVAAGLWAWATARPR